MKVLAQIAKGVTLEIDNEDGKKALRQAIDLANKWCNVCEAVKSDFRLFANEHDDIIYIKRICHDCKSASNLGSFKTGGYFWKKFETYNPDAKKSAQQVANKITGDDEPPLPTEEPDDLPF